MKSLNQMLCMSVFLVLISLVLDLQAETPAHSQEDKKLDIVIDKISIPGHARAVLADVYTARIALFEGHTEAAMDLIKRAKGSFDKSVIQYAIKMRSQDGYGVPVDSSAIFAEGFEPTESQTKVLNRAGDMAKSGDVSGAYKQILSEGISMNFKYAMLPVESTIKNLDKASKAMEAKSYYKANLDLKAVEHSVVAEDFGAYDSPRQGYSWDAVSAGN